MPRRGEDQRDSISACRVDGARAAQMPARPTAYRHLTCRPPTGAATPGPCTARQPARNDRRNDKRQPRTTVAADPSSPARSGECLRTVLFTPPGCPRWCSWLDRSLGRYKLAAASTSSAPLGLPDSSSRTCVVSRQHARLWKTGECGRSRTRLEQRNLRQRHQGPDRTQIRHDDEILNRQQPESGSRPARRAGQQARSRGQRGHDRRRQRQPAP